MESKDLLSGSSEQGESQTIIRSDEKIEVEIRDVIRIRPQDFEAFKNSFEEWASKWE